MPAVVKVVSYIVISEDSMSKEQFETHFKDKPMDSKEYIDLYDDLFLSPMPNVEVDEGPENEPMIDEMTWMENDELDQFLDNHLSEGQTEEYN